MASLFFSRISVLLFSSSCLLAAGSTWDAVAQHCSVPTQALCVNTLVSTLMRHKTHAAFYCASVKFDRNISNANNASGELLAAALPTPAALALAMCTAGIEKSSVKAALFATDLVSSLM